jgi:signal transduction histidine kinase
MLSCVVKKDRPEESRAERNGHHQALQPTVPPGDQPGMLRLKAAVHRLIAAHRADGGPEIEFCDDLTVCHLWPEVRWAVVAIVHELLLNARSHSQSENVLLGLAEDDGCLCVQVQDWGIGFDPESVRGQKRGLNGIRDVVKWLGGTLEIDSQRGKGTCVNVEVPLPREREANIPQIRLKRK